MAKSDEKYRLSNQYVDASVFDPVLYAHTYTKDIDSSYTKIQRRMVMQQYNLFKNGDITGRTFLEIGSGPTLHMAVIPALYFHDIYLSDYVEGNKKILSDWKNQTEGAIDFTSLFQFISTLDKDNKFEADKLESSLRNKIRYILKCDVMLDNPLEPLQMTPFDCITTNTCLESACASLESFEESVASITSLLKSGGHFIITTYLNDEFYFLGENKIECLPITLEQVKSSLSKAGLNILSSEEESIAEGDHGKEMDVAGFVMIHAVKP